MNNNICYVAAAGAGKTTYIIKKAHSISSKTNKKIAIVTFTTHNQNTEKQKFLELYSNLPRNIVICGWYTFLLDYFIRPYKGDVIDQLYDSHISLAYIEPPTIFANGHKVYHYKKGDLRTKYLTKENNIYKDYVSEFAYECLQKNIESLKERCEQIFDTIFLDEAQDFCGYDFEIIKFLIKATTINCIITLDPRQHTYSSSNSRLHTDFKGRLDAFCINKVNTKRKTFINLDYSTLSFSHRCDKTICQFACNIFDEQLPTYSCSCPNCIDRKAYYVKPRGVYLVLESNLKEFAKLFDATVLTFNKSTSIPKLNNRRFNFGECKGDEFESVLIFPTDDILKWLKTNIVLKPLTQSRFYVAVTRAIFTVGIVVPNGFLNNRFGLPFWNPE